MSALSESKRRRCRARSRPPGPWWLLSRTIRPKNNSHGANEDDKIKKQPAVPQIVEIIGQLVPPVLQRGAIGVIDLGPAGDPRLHGMTLVIIRDVLGQPVDEIRPLRTWPDEAHVAA